MPLVHMGLVAKRLQLYLTYTLSSYNDYRYVLVATRHIPYPNLIITIYYERIRLYISPIFKHILAMKIANSGRHILKSSRNNDDRPCRILKSIYSNPTTIHMLILMPTWTITVFVYMPKCVKALSKHRPDLESNRLTL